MADWDAEEYVPPTVNNTVADKWEGEDEDDDVKDDWDASSGDEAKTAGSAVQLKKKPRAERFAENAAKKKAALEEKRRLMEENLKSRTPDELAAEKERMRLQEEEEQLMLAKDLMGVKIETTGIESMNPKTLEEFTEFSKALQTKITQFENHPLYMTFLEDFFRDLSVSLNGENTKKLGSTLNTMANEKQKAEKDKGKKGKKKGASIQKMRDNDFAEEKYEFDDMDDFM